MYTIAFVSTHFPFCCCFLDMNWYSHPQEQKEFQINSLDRNNSQAVPVTAQCQWLLSASTIRYDMAFCMGGSELEK